MSEELQSLKKMCVVSRALAMPQNTYVPFRISFVKYCYLMFKEITIDFIYIAHL